MASRLFTQIAALIPDAAAGQIAATKIFRTIDHVPTIDYLVR
jgi:hypothetical protein